MRGPYTSPIILFNTMYNIDRRTRLGITETPHSQDWARRFRGQATARGSGSQIRFRCFPTEFCKGDDGFRNHSDRSSLLPSAENIHWGFPPRQKLLEELFEESLTESQLIFWGSKHQIIPPSQGSREGSVRLLLTKTLFLQMPFAFQGRTVSFFFYRI